MTTNAQAALQAAATWHSDNPYLVQESVLAAADKFKAWLDEQDIKDQAKGGELAPGIDLSTQLLPSSAGHPDQQAKTTTVCSNADDEGFSTNISTRSWSQ